MNEARNCLIVILFFVALIFVGGASLAPNLPVHDVVIIQSERLQQDEDTIKILKNRVERLEKLVLYLQQKQVHK